MNPLDIQFVIPIPIVAAVRYAVTNVPNCPDAIKRTAGEPWKFIGVLRLNPAPIRLRHYCQCFKTPATFVPTCKLPSRESEPYHIIELERYTFDFQGRALDVFWGTCSRCNTVHWAIWGDWK